MGRMQLVMQLAAVLMIVVSRLSEVSAGGYTGDTYWSPGHATFYGGDNAAGTQGATWTMCVRIYVCVCVCVLRIWMPVQVW
jgi:hypothetical protein